MHTVVGTANCEHTYHVKKISVAKLVMIYRDLLFLDITEVAIILLVAKKVFSEVNLRVSDMSHNNVMFMGGFF